MKPQNFVAKYANEVNRASVQIDRKKEDKRGVDRKAKHKNKGWE